MKMKEGPWTGGSAEEERRGVFNFLNLYLSHKHEKDSYLVVFFLSAGKYCWIVVLFSGAGVGSEQARDEEAESR